MRCFISFFLIFLFVLPVIGSNINSNYDSSLCEDKACPIIADSIADMLPLKKDIDFNDASKSFSNQSYREVNVIIPGTLSDIIGPNINDIDSIVIKGIINDIDFNTLWSASFNGRLSIINIEDATVENGIIPPRAFWHQEEQLQEDGTIYVIALKKIILPNRIKTIGDLAFAYAIHLESINIPSKLQDLIVLPDFRQGVKLQ